MENLPGVIAVLIPIVFLMIPIVAMMTRHQQKMAEIIHGSQNGQLDMMRHELQELKSLVHQQTIQLEDLSVKVRALPSNTVSTL